MYINTFKNILTSIWVQWNRNIMTRQIWMDFGSTREELGRSKKNCRIQVECNGIPYSSYQIFPLSYWKNCHLSGWMQPHMPHSSLLDQYFFGSILFDSIYWNFCYFSFLLASAYTGKKNSYLIFVCGQFSLSFPFDPSPSKLPLVVFCNHTFL